jgi:antitoxin HigA-1
MPRLRIHPGEVLREHNIVPLGLSVQGLANVLGLPVDRLTGIIRGECNLSPDEAVRLGGYFRTNAQFWVNLQSAYKLSTIQVQNRDGDGGCQIELKLLTNIPSHNEIAFDGLHL